MMLKVSLKRNAQLTAVVLCAAAVKLYYSTAGVNQLRWILAPTTVLVELVSGSRFEFESHAGYMSSDRSFVIAASCAGVNFRSPSGSGSEQWSSMRSIIEGKSICISGC